MNAFLISVILFQNLPLVCTILFHTVSYGFRRKQRPAMPDPERCTGDDKRSFIAEDNGPGGRG